MMACVIGGVLFAASRQASHVGMPSKASNSRQVASTVSCHDVSTSLACSCARSWAAGQRPALLRSLTRHYPSAWRQTARSCATCTCASTGRRRAQAAMRLPWRSARCLWRSSLPGVSAVLFSPSSGHAHSLHSLLTQLRPRRPARAAEPLRTGGAVQPADLGLPAGTGGPRPVLFLQGACCLWTPRAPRAWECDADTRSTLCRVRQSGTVSLTAALPLTPSTSPPQAVKRVLEAAAPGAEPQEPPAAESCDASGLSSALSPN